MTQMAQSFACVTLLHHSQMTHTPQNHLVACVISVDVHLFLNCHLWFKLLWHLYSWLVIFHKPVILHKDINGIVL